jgi:hypothetical protein
VTLIDFEIENLEIYNTPSATKFTELQYVDAFTDVGYASVTSSRRERRLEAMDWQRTSAGVVSPTVATPATHLAAFVRPRPPRPRAADRVRRVCLHGVERLQRCLQFLAERYIYIASLLARLAHASCVQSSVAGSTIDVLRIIAQVVGSDGQNVGMVGADPSRTDGVRRAAREPCCDHVRRGRWLRRDGPLSIHPADGLPSELLLWDGSRPGRGARAVQPHRRRLLRAADASHGTPRTRSTSATSLRCWWRRGQPRARRKHPIISSPGWARASHLTLTLALRSSQSGVVGRSSAVVAPASPPGVRSSYAGLRSRRLLCPCPRHLSRHHQ